MLDVTITLPEELGHKDEDTVKEFVAQEVEDSPPDLDMSGELVMEAVEDRVPQTVPDTVRVPLPLLLAQGVEVEHGVPDLLMLGEGEVEKEVVGDFFVPTLEAETRVQEEGLGEEVPVPQELPEKLGEADMENVALPDLDPEEQGV